MRSSDLLHAVHALIDLDQRDRARQAAARLPDDLLIADLLRAADGAQQLARELAALRRDHATEGDASQGHDPHDVRSLYA